MFKDKIKAIIQKNEEGHSKKKMENLVVFVIILIVTIVAINYILGDKTSKQTTQKNTETSSYKQLASTQNEEQNNNSSTSQENNELEQKLENILSKIDGVGEVSVLITYSQSSQVVAMYNESSKTSNTKETDARRWTKGCRTAGYF